MNQIAVDKEIKTNLIREGVIFKRTKFFKEWTQKWMVLTMNFIFIFDSPAKTDLDSFIDLINLKSFKSYVRKDEEMIPSGFKIRSLDDMFYLCARSLPEKWSWIVTLERLMDFKNTGRTQHNNLEFVKAKGFMSQFEYEKGKFDEVPPIPQQKVQNSKEMNRLKKLIEGLQLQKKSREQTLGQKLQLVAQLQKNEERLSERIAKLQASIAQNTSSIGENIADSDDKKKFYGLHHKVEVLEKHLEEEIYEHRVTANILADIHAKYQQVKHQLHYQPQGLITSSLRVASSQFFLDQIASFVGFHPSSQQTKALNIILNHTAKQQNTTLRQPTRQIIEANKTNIKIVHYKSIKKASPQDLSHQIESFVGFNPSLAQVEKQELKEKIILQNKGAIKVVHYKSTLKASNEYLSDQIESFVGFSHSLGQARQMRKAQQQAEVRELAQQEMMKQVKIKVVHYKSTLKASNQYLPHQISSFVGYSPTLAQKHLIQHHQTKGAEAKQINPTNHAIQIVYYHSTQQASPQYLHHQIESFLGSSPSVQQTKTINLHYKHAGGLQRLKQREFQNVGLKKKIKELEKSIEQISRVLLVEQEKNHQSLMQINTLSQQLKVTLRQLQSFSNHQQKPLKEQTFLKAHSETSEDITSSPNLNKSINSASKVSQLKKMFEGKSGGETLSSVNKSAILSKQEGKKKQQNMPMYRKQSVLNLLEQFDGRQVKSEELGFIVEFLVKIGSDRSYGYQAFVINQAKNHANKLYLADSIADFVDHYDSQLHCDKIAKFIEVVIFEAPGLLKEGNMLRIRPKLVEMLQKTGAYQSKGHIIKTMYIIHKFKRYDSSAKLKAALVDFGNNQSSEENKGWAKKLLQDLKA